MKAIFVVTMLYLTTAGCRREAAPKQEQFLARGTMQQLRHKEMMQTIDLLSKSEIEQVEALGKRDLERIASLELKGNAIAEADRELFGVSL